MDPKHCLKTSVKYRIALRQIKDNFTESIQGYTAGNIQITKQNLSLRLLYLWVLGVIKVLLFVRDLYKKNVPIFPPIMNKVLSLVASSGSNFIARAIFVRGPIATTFMSWGYSLDKSLITFQAKSSWISIPWVMT